MVQPATSHNVRLENRLQAPLPAGCAGQWCRVSLRVPARAGWWGHIELTDLARGQIVRSCFLSRLRAVRSGGVRRGMVHVPAQAAAISVRLFGADAAGAALHVEPLSRVRAAASLLWHGRALIGFALAGSAQGRLGRLRAVLGQAPARAGEAPPYAYWIEHCEAALAPPPAAPDPAFQLVVAGADAAARALTLSALQPAPYPAPAIIVVAAPQDWAAVRDGWVVVVAAGEILAPHAWRWFAHAVSAYPDASLITADCDELNALGERFAPLLKPGIDNTLMRNALPMRGSCAVRWQQDIPALPADADAARRALAAHHAGKVVRVPRILTHISATIPAPWPLAATPRRDDYRPHVTALVPTALRAPHVPRCLSRIVRQTAYPDFSVHLVLSDPGRVSPRLLSKVRGLPRVTITHVPITPFNYAAVNNAAAAQVLPGTEDDLLLLLNDDVAPCRTPQGAAWLDAMVAHMQDPSVGIVGARLLYGNGMVQHEGVIMGLAHLCEHAGRLRPYGDSGPNGLGLLDRDVSAVTAACLLIRASLYRALGGMDEAFAIALNDVDLCLRARQAGWRVVYCAGAVLYHYESLSLGRHYAGARAALEATEVRRLQERWGSVIADDPFYNPQASLEPGREWQPAFVPRDTGIGAGASNPAATGW
jgi:GT2 family glycosyltransferase